MVSEGASERRRAAVGLESTRRGDLSSVAIQINLKIIQITLSFVKLFVMLDIRLLICGNRVLGKLLSLWLGLQAGLDCQEQCEIFGEYRELKNLRLKVN